MDLNDYIPTSDVLEVTLKIKDTVLTNEDGTPMTITFYSPHSKEAKAIKHDMVDERISSMSKDGEGTTSLSSAQVDEINTKSLARNIKSWNITMGGKQPKLKEASAIDVLSKAFWIEGLYNEAVEKTMGFMKG